MTSKTISERMRAIGDTPIAYGKDAIEAADTIDALVEAMSLALPQLVGPQYNIARAALAKAQRGL